MMVEENARFSYKARWKSIVRRSLERTFPFKHHDNSIPHPEHFIYVSVIILYANRTCSYMT